MTTRDWTDITPSGSAVYYDIGIHDIDLAVVAHQGSLLRVIDALEE